MWRCLLLWMLLLSTPLYGQQPVVNWADWTSTATAGIDPTLAAIHAWHFSNRPCAFGKFALEEGVGNGSAFLLQHFITSPRPCVGCAPHGMPSAHTTNAFIGFSIHWQIGLAAGAATGILRHVANRHTWSQVVAGAGLGILSDFSGRLLHCES